MFFFRCRECGEVHPVPEWIFHELAPDGIWARCPNTGKYSLHKLLPGDGVRKAPKARALHSLEPEPNANTARARAKIARLRQLAAGLLGMKAPQHSP